MSASSRVGLGIAAAASLVLSGCVVPVPVPASAVNGSDDGAGYARTRGVITPIGGVVVIGGGARTTEETTAAIVARLGAVWRECQALGQAAYNIDCLAEGYVRASDVIPQDAIFGESRTAILQAAARLEALAAANRAAAAPEIGGGGRSRPLRAVDPARLAAANAAAVRILDETQTVLLRSAQASEERRVPFEKIAAAVGSSKVLLRSA